MSIVEGAALEPMVGDPDAPRRSRYDLRTGSFEHLPPRDEDDQG